MNFDSINRGLSKSTDITIDTKRNPVLIDFNVFGQGFLQEYGPLLGEYKVEVLKNYRVKLFSF